MALSDLLDEFSETAKEKNLRDGLKLVPILDDYLYNLNFDKAAEAKSYGGEIERGFHPSALVKSECHRKLALDFFGCEAEDGEWEIDASLRRIFDNGHGVHDRLQEYLQDMARDEQYGIKLLGTWKCRTCGAYHGDVKSGPIVEPEECGVPIEVVENDGRAEEIKCEGISFKYKEWRLRHKELRITGKCDGILEFRVNDERVLLELKSMNTFGFGKLQYVAEYHLDQIHMYMFLSGIHKTIYWYEDKNNQKIKEYVLEYDSSKISQILEDLQDVNDLLDKKKLPKKQTDPKICKKCPYRNFCDKFKIPKDWKP